MLVKTIIAAGLLVAIASEANAITLATGPLHLAVGGAGSELACSVANVGNSPVMVTLTATVGDETPVVVGPLFIVPGATESLFAENEAAESELGFCKFGVTGRVASLRASGCALDADGACASILPAQ